MKETQVITDVKAERSCKMDELLNKMVECFNEAFPGSSELAQWLADANQLLIENSETKHIEAAKSLTWCLGWQLLPCLIQAEGLIAPERKRVRTGAIIDAFYNLGNGKNLSKGLPLINYLTYDNSQDCYWEPCEWDRIKTRIKALDVLGEFGDKYELLRSDEREDLKAGLQRKREEEIESMKTDIYNKYMHKFD